MREVEEVLGTGGAFVLVSLAYLKAAINLLKAAFNSSACSVSLPLPLPFVLVLLFIICFYVRFFSLFLFFLPFAPI